MATGISKEKIIEMVGKKTVIHLIDIRTNDEYVQSHIPGAVNIPAEEAGNISFNKNDIIVCVCNHGHKRSQGAADSILAMGFTNTFYLEGGTAGWLNDNSIEHHQ